MLYLRPTAVVIDIHECIFFSIGQSITMGIKWKETHLSHGQHNHLRSRNCCRERPGFQWWRWGRSQPLHRTRWLHWGRVSSSRRYLRGIRGGWSAREWRVPRGSLRPCRGGVSGNRTGVGRRLRWRWRWRWRRGNCWGHAICGRGWLRRCGWVG